MENIAQPKKRPTGMTILLVLSFLNACLSIFSNIIMFFATPMLSTMLENGQFEDAMAPFESTMSEDMQQSMMDSMTMLANIKPVYYAMMLVLFIGSLIGVIRMFKGNKTGLHFYAIAQILMLIASSIYKYPLLSQSPFLTDMLLTAMFIFVYYSYFKRLEVQQDPMDQNQNNSHNPFQE